MTVQEYLTPRSLPEAVDLLARYGSSVLVMGGGTVAMPLINDGVSLPDRVMSLRQAKLDRIEAVEGEIVIGAMTTLTQLLAQDQLPLLAVAARNTASWAIRNMATIGGNLFTPPPGGDVGVALLALGAHVRLVGPAGQRTLPLADFWTGFMTTALTADELLTHVIVPARARETAYIKFGRKHSNTPSVVTVAIALDREDGRVVDPRIALGAVGPHPMRATAAEAVLFGKALTPATVSAAADAAAGDCKPFTDAVASAWYRRRMTALFVRRALEKVAGRS